MKKIEIRKLNNLLKSEKYHIVSFRYFTISKAVQLFIIASNFS